MAGFFWFGGAGEAQQSGAAAYTLAVDAGSYAVTGTSATLKYGRVVAAGAGSYAITGSSATLQKNLPIAATAGSYAVSGTVASLEYGRILVPVAGSYAISGTAASLEYGYVLGALPGSYAITGSAATLTYTPVGAYTLAVDAGSYALTGTDAGLYYGYAASADPGSYTISGTAATLTYVPVAATELAHGGWLSERHRETEQTERQRRHKLHQAREALETAIREAYDKATGKAEAKAGKTRVAMVRAEPPQTVIVQAQKLAAALQRRSGKSKAIFARNAALIDVLEARIDALIEAQKLELAEMAHMEEMAIVMLLAA